MFKVSLIVLVLLPVLAVAYLFIMGRASQKGEAPGLMDGKLAACPNSPNCVSSDASESGHAIAPLVFDSEKFAPADAWVKIQEVVKSLPGTKITSSSENYLSAECASGIFRFVDDLELQLRPEQSEIAIRSASRVGRSDFGANRKRVEILRAKFEAATQ